MAKNNALNKNSVYVSSLVNFILDTKPYHVKLTEIVEEYRFFDDVKVKIKERFSSKMKIDSTWMYNYFSSANPMFRTTPAMQLVSPTFKTSTHRVGRDENTDLALVPYAYSKKTFDGDGVNQVYIRHGNFVEPLTESVDYFQSHGSFQFQVKQTINANGKLDPLWSSTVDEDLISEARNFTRKTALDTTNPNSAINRIRSLLDKISEAVVAAGGHTEVQRELNILYAVLDRGDLPGRQDWTSQYDPNTTATYTALFAWLAIPNSNDVLVTLDAPYDREYFEQQFSQYSSPLFFGMFTDLGVRESGRVEYGNEKSEHLSVTNLKVTEGKDIEEWTFTTTSPGSSVYRISGSMSGFVGFIGAGDSFDNGRLSFKTTQLSVPTGDDTVVVAPTRRIVIGSDAPLETWNLIKVNPIAHDRPRLVSKRFGHIQDLDGKIGNVSILSPSAKGDYTLTYRGNGVFDIAGEAPGTVTVGKPFNNGLIGFTIVKGQNEFLKGDRFYISIVNLDARAENLDLGYGYDLDPYDDDTITKYPDGGIAGGKYVGFYYDGRFTDYDLASLNLKINAGAIDGRKWRLRAVPDYSRPITDVPGIPDISENLSVFYADSFVLEYSDDDFTTKSVVDNVKIGESYSTDEHGISFTLAAGSRPFVAVSVDDNGTLIEGGDIFSFEVTNPFPQLGEVPVGLAAANMPRLLMHSDSFFDAPAAKWVVEFNDANTYTVTGIQGETTYGPIATKILPVGKDAREGYSFKGLGVHFTIVPTGGIVAGEKFTFETFEKKPTYLVHGSVTGFTKPANVGEYYWNGKIGFKIPAATAEMFVNHQKVDEPINFTLREDCPALIYTFTRKLPGYQVVRSDTGESRFVTATFQDKYLSVDLANVTEPEFQLVVDAHDYTLWNSADLVIINPVLRSRLPVAGEEVIIEKTEEGKFSLNLVPRLADISALNPVTIDQRFIDTNTRGVSLTLTSPETALLQGWIPLTTIKKDSDTSLAEFSDPATQLVFRSSSNDEPVGVLKNNIFEWDAGFFEKYLPLNAEANLVIQGTGWNDHVAARITESVKFLLGGGIGTEDWMFSDEMKIDIVDSTRFNIVTNYNEVIQTVINDGPFGGFMAGYGNLPYDTYGFDVGQPLDLQSLLSKAKLTDGQKKDIFDQWNNYLESPNLPSNEEQWAFVRAALAGDPNPGLITPDFGYPVVGMGIDIVDNSENSASASIVETMSVRVNDKGNLLDANNYDTGMLDRVPENGVIMYSGSMPPVPTSIPLGTTYETLETPLTVEDPVQAFEISFNASPSVLATFAPTFSIWFPDATSAIKVPVVEKMKPGVFRFTVARPTRAKIIVG